MAQTRVCYIIYQPSSYQLNPVNLMTELSRLFRNHRGKVHKMAWIIFKLDLVLFSPLVYILHAHSVLLVVMLIQRSGLGS